MTIAAMLQLSKDRLAPLHGAQEAAAMSVILVEHVCQLDRKQQIGQQQRALTPVEIQTAMTLLESLMQGQPLQYVLQEAWFCGLRLKVGPGVLIPRPETEELVEWIISHCRFPLQSLHLLDVGTGSGCIAIALKRRLRKATVAAIDIAPEALQLARANAATLGAAVDFWQADILDLSRHADFSAYDIIVSNPPYISEEEKTNMHPTVLEHEPHQALFAPGDDPFIFYRALATFAYHKLHQGGQLFLELNSDHAGTIDRLVQEKGLQTQIKKDMQGKDRMLRAWRA